MSDKWEIRSRAATGVQTAPKPPGYGGGYIALPMLMCFRITYE